MAFVGWCARYVWNHIHVVSTETNKKMQWLQVIQEDQAKNKLCHFSETSNNAWHISKNELNELFLP